MYHSISIGDALKKTKITGFMETDTEGIFILYFLFLFWFALRTPVRRLNDLFAPPVPIDLYDLYTLYKKGE